MPNSDIVLSADAEIGDINNNKGKLIYKINCATDKSNFAINTILKNSGVTKADGAAITATDVTTTPLQIKGGENFFKAKAGGGSNLTRFSLNADCEEDSDLATEMKKLNYGNVSGVESENYNKFYNGNSSYKEKLSNDSYAITLDELKELKAEAERLVEIADNCVTALGNSASDDLKILLDYAKRFNNSVTLEGSGTSFTLSVQAPVGITSTVSDTDINKGRLLFAAIDSAIFLVQELAYIVVTDNLFSNSIIKMVKDSYYYSIVESRYEELKQNNNNDRQKGREVYTTLISELEQILNTSYFGATAKDIVTLLCIHKLNVDSQFSLGVYDMYYGVDTLFKWLGNYKRLFGGLNYINEDRKKCFNNDSNLKQYYCPYIEGYETKYLKYITDDFINMINFIIEVDLELNETPSTTSTDVFQTGNTYQIFETTDQKIYWGTGEDADKLVFEIPMDFPEQTTDGSKITNIKISDVYKNPDYLATENATSGT